jgi:hypothetical protein
MHGPDRGCCRHGCTYRRAGGDLDQRAERRTRLLAPPGRDAETFTDGWLHSGDIGRFDDDGFVSSSIAPKTWSSAAEKISRALRWRPGFTSTPMSSRQLCSRCRTQHSVRKSPPWWPPSQRSAFMPKVREHAADRLAAFKVPAKAWITATPLPCNPAGKVLKRELQARYAVSMP